MVRAELASGTSPPFGAAPSQTLSQLVDLFPGVVCKLEANLPGGSHKARAARWVVEEAVCDGRVRPGKTLILEKTGGNFGLGLALACRKYALPLELAVGLSFSESRRRYLEYVGARLIGRAELEGGETPRQIIEARIASLREARIDYFFTDQFSNPSCLRAHEFETGPELARLARERYGVDKLVFIGCAGTGASFTGVVRALRKAGVETAAILVEPAGCDSKNGLFCDHPLEGMCVGVAPPFLDWSLVDDVIHVDAADACEMRRSLFQDFGLIVGNSSAACLFAARRVADPAQRDRLVAAIAYDHGLWYPLQFGA